MRGDTKSTLRRALVGALVAGSCAIAGQAQADAITSSFPSSTNLQIKYNNLETLVNQVNQTLTGIFDITTIGKAPTGIPIYFASGGTAGELNGIFTDLTVAEIQPVTGGDNIYFTGGTMSIFNVPTGSYNPTGPTDPLNPQVCGAAACPSPWLTLNFVPGVITADIGATAFNETTTTLFSTVNSLASPLTGTGDAYLAVTGGTAAGAFGIGSLFTLQSNLQSCPAPSGFGANCAGTWPIASFDPVTATTVPEPGTLFLVAIGLLGAGYAGRRRYRRNAA